MNTVKDLLIKAASINEGLDAEGYTSMEISIIGNVMSDSAQVAEVIDLIKGGENL